MKKGIRKIIAALVALCAAIPCAVSPVFANSGPRYEHGVTASGTIVQGEKSALAVESEKLTFDIKDFPVDGRGDIYESTVTAEYKFVNTSQNTVRTSMAFPLGKLPGYFDSTAVADKDLLAAEITVNGAGAEVSTRHTLGTYENFAESVKQIYDGWYSDGFYNTDLTVTEYSVDMSTGNYGCAYAVGEVECDALRARFIGKTCNYDDEMRYVFEKQSISGGTPYDGKAVASQHFYVLGDNSAFNCEWHAEVSANSGYKRADLPVTVEKTREFSLKEFVLEMREEDCAVGDMDFYNGIVRRFKNGALAFPFYEELYGDEDFLVWYTYDVEVSAGGSVVNTVTAPIFPSRDYGYSPDVYDYKYYLSPAANWQSFGKLEIVINTEYYLTAQSVKFTAKEGGYTASLNGLPSGELSFSLCSTQNPEREKNVFGITVSVFVLAILFIIEALTLGSVIYAVVYLVKSRKKLKT